jgi:hypothetical protein
VQAFRAAVLSHNLKDLRHVSANEDAETGNHSRWSELAMVPVGHGQPTMRAVPAYPACSSSEPSGVSTCRTALPWRQVLIRPASRSTDACWLTAAGEMPIR